MAKLDWRFEDEAQRLGAQLPQSRAPAAPSAPSAPSAAAAPARPAVPPGTAAGQAVRAGIIRTQNASASAAERALNTFSEPFRVGVGEAHDFGRAVTGQRPRADAGTPVAGITFPRMGAPASPAAPVRPVRPVRGGQPMAKSFDRMGSATPAGTAPGGMNANNPNMSAGGNRLPAGVTKTVGPDGVTTYTGTPGAAPALDLGTIKGNPGIASPFTRAGAPTAAVGQPVAVGQPAAFDPRAIARAGVADLRGVANTVRNDAAAGLNPTGADAEIMRRLEHRVTGYKGFPSARAAMAEGYLGQLAARRGASAAFQQGATGAIDTGTTGGIQEGLAAQDNLAQARTQRADIAGRLRLQRDAVNQPQVLGGAEDGVLRLRRGGVAQAITDEKGNPIRQAAAPVAGALTPKDLLGAYSAEREAITASLGSPEEKQAALTALDANPLFQPLLGGQGGAAAPAPGTVVDGYRFLGGDPADPAAWEQQ